MDEAPRQAGEGMNHDHEDRTPEDVRADIEQTRAELGDTVEALAAKTDVKGQAKRAVHDAGANVKQTASDARQAVSAKRDGAVSAAQQAAPDSAGDAGRRVSQFVQENRTALIPALALGLGLLLGRRRTR
jgi:hypothetical protein